MKIKKIKKPSDPSITSIEILTYRIEEFFNERSDLNSHARFYPENPHSNFPSGHEKVDVILFGNAFKSLMTSGLWPFKEVRLWCLSRRYQSFLSKLFPKIEIRVINRGSLFSLPLLKSKKEDKPWKSHSDLIYAGRISAQKNIESLIYTAHFLQSKGIPCTLHLIGDFDDHYHEHLGRRLHTDYEQRIRKLISSLPWQSPPIIHQKMPPFEWIKIPFKRPIAISFSSFFCEDFGVSLSQMAQEGWPIICSNYGGHADIYDTPIIKCPDIPHSHLPLEVIEKMSMRVADFLVQNKIFQTERAKESITFSSDFSSIKLLDQQRRKLALRIGRAAHLIGLDSLEEFADTDIGASIIHTIQQELFCSVPTVVIILFDCDRPSIMEKDAKELEQILLNIPLKFRIRYLSSKNIFHKNQLKILMDSQSIYLILEKNLKEDIQKVLDQNFGIKTNN